MYGKNGGFFGGMKEVFMPFFFLFIILFQLAITGLVVYVAWHFISKYW